MTNETISAPRFIEVVTGQDKAQRKIFVNLHRINNIEVRSEKSGEEHIVLNQTGDRLELQGQPAKLLLQQLQQLDQSGYFQWAETARGAGGSHRT